MKYSVATIAALATAAMAKPVLLNTDYAAVIGTPFTIKFSGCDSGCTIILQNGNSKDLKDYETLTATAKGDSFTWTPKDLPTDEYNYKIIDNSDETEFNYSSQFTIVGDVEATSTAESTSAESTSAESTSAESTSAKATSTKEATTLSTKAVTTTEEETTISTPAATSHNSTTPAATSAEASSTEESSSTASDDSSSTSAATTSSTTVPDSGAARMTSSIALIAGAVMAMVYLN
ncbi:hypothetical protein G7Z17_g10687 [Cylindrodendrum hubeiense]|uniref:Yeast cell wall synthesis Kre9/Knh1-like N-terminal domain-containing protein n=1 Tax=Cylindrodendrum hubeiense TaxID=595255 RepID=A0A9P5H289_9HYPO|nr:hypothetical protein G7Z17_g10687 [Cylindrodendrum hubeiense]